MIRHAPDVANIPDQDTLLYLDVAVGADVSAKFQWLSPSSPLRSSGILPQGRFVVVKHSAKVSDSQFLFYSWRRSATWILKAHGAKD